MGSLFSAPSVTSPLVKSSLKNLGNTASSISSDLSGTSNAIGQSLTPINFNAGGLSSTISDGSLNINSDANRTGQVNALSTALSNQANQYVGLAKQIAPGMSALRASQLADIEAARQASISNLSDNLARRGVLGSSFGSDAATRTNLSFEAQRNDVIAQTTLQELDATNQLIGQAYTAKQNAITNQINELNLQGNLGTTLTAQATDSLKASAQFQTALAQTKATTSVGLASDQLSNATTLGTEQAKLDAGAQAGAGNLIGTAAAIGLAPATGGLSLAAIPGAAPGVAKSLYGTV